MDVREYDLNLIPGNVPQVIKINQYDKGIPLTFIIYQGDKKFSIPSGAIVALSGTKPDGLGFHYACTFSGSTASVTIGDQVAVLSGNVRAELTITSGDSVRLGTANFAFCVEPAALKDDTAVSDSDFPEIIKAVNNIGAAQKSADAAAKSAQDAKSSASSAASAASNAISGEVTRAKAAEKANADAISAEVTRAKAAEKTNADAIKTKMEKDPVSFFQVASTAINRVGFSYISQMTDAPSGVNTFGHILIDAQTGRIGGDKDNKVIFFIPYDTDKIFYRLVHDGHVNDWVEMAPYSAVTTLSNQLTALGTDSYSLVDFVNDKKSLNTNDDYLHAYLVAGVTYVFSGDTTYKSFRSISDDNTTLSTVGGTKANASYTPETSGMYCLRWYKAASDTALATLKLTCSTVGGAHQHLAGLSKMLNTSLENLSTVVSTKSALVPTGTQIWSGSDLNDLKYTVVGSYFCPAVVDGQTLKNTPEKTAFMMSVYNPLSKDTGKITAAWQYRLQEIITYDAKHKYIRMVSSDSNVNISYGEWRTEF